MTISRTPKDIQRDPFLADPAYDPTSQEPYHPPKHLFPDLHPSTNEEEPVAEEVEAEERAAAAREGRDYVAPSRKLTGSLGSASMAEERAAANGQEPPPHQMAYRETPEGERTPLIRGQPISGALQGRDQSEVPVADPNESGRRDATSRPADVPIPSNPGTPPGQRPATVPPGPTPPAASPTTTEREDEMRRRQFPPAQGVSGSAEEVDAARTQPGAKDSPLPRPTPESERTPLIRGQPISGALQGANPDDMPVAHND